MVRFARGSAGERYEGASPGSSRDRATPRAHRDEFRPHEVRLFGSRARGEGTTTSDWDLFIIVPDDLAAADDAFAGYRLKREMRTNADVILCPISEFAEDRNTPNTLAYEAAHNGIAIYER